MTLKNLSPIDLFLTGHAISFAGIYFNQVLLLSELIKTGQPGTQEYATGWQEWLKSAGGEFVEKINLVTNTLGENGLPAPERPRFPDNYFEWADAVHKMCAQALDFGDIKSVPFTFGYGLGETACDMVVWQRSLDIQAKLGLDWSGQIKHVKQDLQNVLFRWNVSVSLLGTDERLHPLWVSWTPIKEKLDILTRQESLPNEFSEASLVLNQLSELHNQACDLLVKPSPC